MVCVSPEIHLFKEDFCKILDNACKLATFYNDVFPPFFFFLPLVLINVYTVTPDLRPVNDKVIQNEC